MTGLLLVTNERNRNVSMKLYLQHNPLVVSPPNEHGGPLASDLHRPGTGKLHT